MTQEEKQLLLVDLCARLPYGVFVKDGNRSTPVKCDFECHPNLDDLENIKPYLRPMSSMTKEEENEYKMFIDYSYNDFTSESFPCVYVDKINDYLDWLNARQFDYRGLIPMGLALPATEGIYNIK